MEKNNDLKILENKVQDMKKNIGQNRADIEKSDNIYHVIVENASAGIVIAQDHHIQFVNSPAAELMGYSIEEMTSRQFVDFVHPDDREMVYDRHRKRINRQYARPVYNFRVLTKNKALMWVEVKVVIIEFAGKPATLNYLSDITRQKQAEAELELYRNRLEEIVEQRTAEYINANAKLQQEIVERNKVTEALKKSEDRYKTIIGSIEEGYFEVDLAGNLTFFNRAMLKIADATYDELLGINNLSYTTPETAKRMYKVFSDIYKTGKPVTVMDYEIIRKDGTKRVLEVSTSLIDDSKNKPSGFRGIARDVTERKKYEEKLVYLAYHDPLTGLFNRKAFMERMEETLAFAVRYKTRIAILFIDLDRFKEVNDRFGHKMGDIVLQKVSKRLQASIRQSDYICRMGGDEFTVILRNPSEFSPAKIADNLLKKISKPYCYNNIIIDFVTPSIGISLFPDDGHDVEHLIKCADTAMYAAKETKNRCVSYNECQLSH